MWPFSKKNKEAAKNEDWYVKATELCRKMVKIKVRTGPQVAKTVLAGQEITPQGQETIELEVLVFCLHVCERLVRERFGVNVPSTFTALLVDRAGVVLTEEVRSEYEKEKQKTDLKNVHSDRVLMYQNYTKLRGERGESDRGTLVDGFGKILTSIYSKNNALARTMLTAQGIEIVKTLPHYLDDLGMKAA